MTIEGKTNRKSDAHHRVKSGSLPVSQFLDKATRPLPVVENTHHAFPTSARHGLRWWQIDVSFWVIVALSWLRLAWNLKLPSPQLQIARKSST